MGKFSIVEVSLHGHRINYLTMIVDALLARGDEVVIYCPDWQNEEYARLLDRYSDNRNCEIQGVVGRYSKKNSRWYRRPFLFRKAAISSEVERVIMTTADGTVYWVCAMLPILMIMRKCPPVYLGLLRGDSLVERKNILGKTKFYILSFALRYLYWFRLVVFDKRLSKELSQNSSYLSEKVILAADPVDVIDLSGSDKIANSNNELRIGAFGFMDERKNLEVLIESALEINKQQKGKVVKLCIVGSFEEEYWKKIQAKTKSCKTEYNWQIDNTFLEESELNLTIKKCDIVWVAYKNHNGPSSFLIKSVALGVWPLFSNLSWLKEFSKKWNVGDAIPSSNKELVELLQKYCDTPNSIKVSNFIAEQVKEEHSKSSFLSAFID